MVKKLKQAKESGQEKNCILVMMRRMGAALLILVMAMGIFAGCAEKESPSATASASKSSTVTGSKTTSRSSVASGTKA
ncbi:MAG: hypothetical protein PHG48_08275, partial [Eubacteriales bacterium]|nr:hypothetical protein [Eubacteriales bacterium]